MITVLQMVGFRLLGQKINDTNLTFWYFFLEPFLVFRYYCLCWVFAPSSECFGYIIENHFRYHIADFFANIYFAFWKQWVNSCLVDSYALISSLPASIPLPLPEMISSPADIAHKLQLCPTYKLVFGPNLAISRRKKEDDHQFAVNGANKKR